MAIVKVDGIEINTEKVQIDDMPTPLFREIYEYCGSETAILLLKNMVGTIIQVPTRGFSKIIKRIVLSDFDGTTESIRKICRTHKVTQNYVRQILKDARVDAPLEGQKSFNFSMVNTDAE